MEVRSLVNANQGKADETKLVLRHIGHYRLSLRHVIARRFSEGRDPGTIIKKWLNQVW